MNDPELRVPGDSIGDTWAAPWVLTVRAPEPPRSLQLEYVHSFGVVTGFWAGSGWVVESWGRRERRELGPPEMNREKEKPVTQLSRFQY